jgi:hypothetical protein
MKVGTNGIEINYALEGEGPVVTKFLDTTTGRSAL